MQNLFLNKTKICDLPSCYKHVYVKLCGEKIIVFKKIIDRIWCLACVVKTSHVLSGRVALNAQARYIPLTPKSKHMPVAAYGFLYVSGHVSTEQCKATWKERSRAILNLARMTGFKDFSNIFKDHNNRYSSVIMMSLGPLHLSDHDGIKTPTAQ